MYIYRFLIGLIVVIGLSSPLLGDDSELEWVVFADTENLYAAGYRGPVGDGAGPRSLEVAYDRRTRILSTYNFNKEGKLHGWHRIFRDGSLIFSHYWINGKGVTRTYDSLGELATQTFVTDDETEDVG